MRKFVPAAVMAIVGAGVWLVPDAARAGCQCPTPASGNVVKDLGRFKHAFAGRVTNVEQAGASTKVTFDLQRAWKGQRGKTLTLTTAASADACGYAFENGKDYLVFANGDKGALTTDGCAPNSALGEAAAAVRQLDLHSGYGANPLRLR